MNNSVRQESFGLSFYMRVVFSAKIAYTGFHPVPSARNAFDNAWNGPYGCCRSMRQWLDSTGHHLGTCAVGMVNASDVDMCYILSYSIYLADGNRGVGCNGEWGVDRSPFKAIWHQIGKMSTFRHRVSPVRWMCGIMGLWDLAYYWVNGIDRASTAP